MMRWQVGGSNDVAHHWFLFRYDGNQRTPVYRTEAGESRDSRDAVVYQTKREAKDQLNRLKGRTAMPPTELGRRRALRCQTCNGPTRETTGLICQTCGWDYGKDGSPTDTTPTIEQQVFEAIFDATPVEVDAFTARNAAGAVVKLLFKQDLPVGLVLSEDGSLLNWQGVNYVRQDSTPPSYRGWVATVENRDYPERNHD